MLGARTDLIVFGGITAFGIGVTAVSLLTFGSEAAYSLGPGTFPLWLGALLLFLGGITVLQQFIAAAANGMASERALGQEDSKAQIHLMVGGLLVAGYVALTPIIGFTLTSAAFVLAFNRLQRGPWTHGVCLAVFWIALIVAAKTYLFLQIPTGILGM